MGDTVFDEKRMDMMMDFYKAEILKMQRAGLPEEAFQPKEEPEVEKDKVQEDDSFIKEIREKQKELRPVFGIFAEAEGRFEPFDKEEEFEFLKGEVKGRFSPFANNLADLQRGEKLLEVKFGEYCFPFISLPCYFADSFCEFKSLIASRLGKLYDKGALWKLLCQNKELLDAVLYNFSDMGTPALYQSARYFSPAYICAGKEVFAFKLILEPERKERPFSDFEAGETAANDRDYLKRNLIESLEGGKNVSFTLSYQRIEKESFKGSIFKPSYRWDVEKIPLGKLVFEKEGEEDFSFSMTSLPKNIYLSKGVFYDICSAWEGTSFNDKSFFEEVSEEDDNGFLKASSRLHKMKEKEARRLKENITASMEGLSGEALEKALLILTEADMDFGKSLMNMIEA